VTSSGSGGPARRGTSTSAFGVGKREGHDSSAFYDRFQPPVTSDDEQINAPKMVDQIVVGDARNMTDVADASVALVVTSPPYFAGKAYETELGKGHIPADYVAYLQMLRDVFAECLRVLEPGGRIAVNVANLGRRPYRSLAADVTAILQDDLRMLLRGEVVWVKQRGAAGNCAWGSFQRPANPVLRDLTERVIIASKGRFDRAVDVKARAKAGLPSVVTMTRDEFMEATTDVWEMPPESASRVGHPAPFPVALPERLIHMHTYVGDLVLDPFMGSGTTAVAAVRTGRHYVGYDTSAEYVAAAQQRISAATQETQRDAAVRVLASDGRRTDPVVGGWAAKDLAREVLAAAGFTAIDDEATVTSGVQPTFRASAADGSTWWIDVVGGRTSNRPGAQRIDLVWRTIARASVVHELEPDSRFGVLTVGLPSAASGGRALQAVTGSGKPITLIADLLDEAAHAVLQQACANQNNS
jgi:DNA modification methylase